MDIALNWLWQGGLVALVASAIVRAIPASRTQARYFVLWTACIAVAVLPGVAILLDVAAGMAASPGWTPPLAPALLPIPVAWWTSAEIALALWVIWGCAYTVRIGTATVSLLVARRTCTPCPPDREMRFQHWVRVRGVGRPTRIVVSTRVASAAVLGGGSPLIALAPALLEHLGDADLDRVVVHEWAHVQRRDDLAQFCQLVLRVIAGWHPAVWWLERRLELEREVACDEKVVAVTGSARDYAVCLTILAALRNRVVHALPVPAAISSSGLRARVVRILGQRGGLIRPWRAMAICSSTALATFSAIIGGVPLVEPAAISLDLVHPPSPAPMFAEQRSAKTGSAVYIPTRAQTQSGERPGHGAQLVSRVQNDRVAAPVVSAAQSAPAVIDPPSYVPEAPVPGSIATSTVTDVPAASADQPDANASAGEGVSVPATARDPWIAVADAGVAVGRGSQNAGIATAGFFTRFGKKIANSF